MTITLKTHDKAQSMSILRYLKKHGAKYKIRIEDGMNNLGGMVLNCDRCGKYYGIKDHKCDLRCSDVRYYEKYAVDDEYIIPVIVTFSDSNETTYIIEIEDDDKSMNAVSDLLNLR